MSEFQRKYDGKLLSPSDVAAILGVTLSRIHQLTAKNAIPVARTLNGRRVYAPKDIDAVKAERTKRGL